MINTKMTEPDLYQKLNIEIEQDNYSKVVTLWEDNGWKNFDFSKEKDREICDMISSSYSNLNNKSKALFYINSRIDYMTSSSGFEDRVEHDFANWDFYNSLKSNILYEEEDYKGLYKMTLCYKKLGGTKELYLSSLDMLETFYYQNKVRPFLNKLSYYLMIVIGTMAIIGFVVKNEITRSHYYDLFLAIGALIVIAISYFDNIVKNIVTSLIRILLRI